MGKPVEQSHHTDQEFLRKFKILFDEVRAKEDNSLEEPITFSTFVDAFDVEDKLTKRLFECLLREHRRKNRRTSSTQHRGRSRRASDLNAWSQMFRSRRHQSSQQILESLNIGNDNPPVELFRAAVAPMFSIRAGAGGTFESEPSSSSSIPRASSSLNTTMTTIPTTPTPRLDTPSSSLSSASASDSGSVGSNNNISQISTNVNDLVSRTPPPPPSSSSLSSSAMSIFEPG